MLHEIYNNILCIKGAQMKDRKSFVLESVSFGFKSLVEHVRLFVFAIPSAMGVIAVVTGILALLNLRFLQTALMRLSQDYQECVGYNCASAVYESGRSLLAPSMALVVVIFSVIVLAIFVIGIDLGFKKIALNLHDRHTSSLKAMFSCFAVAPKALVAWFLYSAMIFIGLLCFVLPGFIALLRFAFFPYFIIDKNAGPIDALKMSYEATKNHVWDVFALWVVIKIIGYIALLGWMGIFLTWPLSTLAYAFFYRKLLSDNTHEYSRVAVE